MSLPSHSDVIDWWKKDRIDLEDGDFSLATACSPSLSFAFTGC
jgi:hypothetical protein